MGVLLGGLSTLSGCGVAALLSFDNAPPAQLTASAGAYDPASNSVVLFSGLTQHGWYSNTWIWSGSTWSNLQLSHHPPPRNTASFACDPLTNQCILFGGAETNVGPILGDTWSWSKGKWSELKAKGPSPRLGAAMAYDPSLKGIVLFGGANEPGAQQYIPFDGTWLWNGRSWGKLHPTHSPPPLLGAKMVFDYSTNQLILTGGIVPFRPAMITAWAYYRGDWHSMPAPPMYALSYPSMAYDRTSKTVVLFGGMGSLPGQLTNPQNLTWLWNGQQWKRDNTKPAPSARWQAVLAPNPSGGLILIGGQGPGSDRNWRWSNSKWHRLS